MFIFSNLEYNAESSGDESNDEESVSKSSKTKKSRKVTCSTDEDNKTDYNKYSSIQGEGLIKTRSQREAELLQAKQFEKSQLANPTFDADSVWESMKNDGLNGVKKNTNTTTTNGSGDKYDSDRKSSTPSDSDSAVGELQKEPVKDSRLKEEYITIKRVYKFAGKVETEEKRVLKSSDEAIAYLKQQDESKNDVSEKHNNGLPTQEYKYEPGKKRKNSMSSTKRRGPVKRKQGSLLDELNSLKPKKLNTLEKSKMDWLGYVDQEGIKDELTLHNKDGYLQKQDFLSRVDTRLENNIKSNIRR